MIHHRDLHVDLLGSTYMVHKSLLILDMLPNISIDCQDQYNGPKQLDLGK